MNKRKNFVKVHMYEKSNKEYVVKFVVKLIYLIILICRFGLKVTF